MYFDPKYKRDSDLPDDITLVSAERCMQMPDSPRIREFLGRWDAPSLPPLPIERDKMCCGCREIVPIEGFRMYRHSNGATYRHSLCKACGREQVKGRMRQTRKWRRQSAN